MNPLICKSNYGIHKLQMHLFDCFVSLPPYSKTKQSIAQCRFSKTYTKLKETQYQEMAQAREFFGSQKCEINALVSRLVSSKCLRLH